MDLILRNLSHGVNKENSSNLLLYVYEDASQDKSISKFHQYNSTVLRCLENIICEGAKDADNFKILLKILSIVLDQRGTGEPQNTPALFQAIHHQAREDEIKILECDVIYKITRNHPLILLDNYAFIMEAIEMYFMNHKSKYINLASARVLLTILKSHELVNCKLIARDIESRVKR